MVLREKIDKTIMWCFKILIFGAPLIFIDKLNIAFEIPKSIFFRETLAIILVLMAVKIAMSRKTKFPIIKKRIIISFLGFMAIIVGATIFSSLPHVSFWGSYERQQGLLQNLNYVVLFTVTLLYLYEDKKRTKEIITTIGYSSILTSVIALTYVSTYSRLGGTMAQPAYLSSFLILTYPIILINFIKEHKRKKLFWGVSSVIILFTLLMTGSRSAIIGLTIILFLTAIIYKKKRYFVYIILMLGAVTLLNFNSGFLNGKIVERYRSSDKSMQSIEIRKYIWRGGLKEILDKPILGYGLEMTKEGFYKYQPKELLELGNNVLFVDRLHNEIFDLLVQIGILGTTFYMIFFISIISKGIKRRKESDVFMITVGLIAYFITNMFNFSTNIHDVFLWLMLAILLSLTRFKKHQFKVKKHHSDFIIIVSSIYLIWSTIFGIKQVLADYEFKNAKIYFSELNHIEAFKKYDRAMVLNPNEIEYPLFASQHALITAMYNKKLHDVSLKKATTYLNKIKKNGGGDMMKYLFLKGMWCEVQKQYVCAEEFYNKAYKKAPLYMPLLNRMGKL